MSNNNPLSICMITPHYPPIYGWQGSGRACMEQAHALSALGHQVEVICCAQDSSGESYQDGIKVIRTEWKKDTRLGKLLLLGLPRLRLLLNMHFSLWQTFLKASKNTRYDVIEVCGFSGESIVPTLLGTAPVHFRDYNCQPGFIREEFYSVDQSECAFQKNTEEVLRQLGGSCADSFSAASGEKPANLANFPIDTQMFRPDGPKALNTGDRPALLIFTSVRNPKYEAFLIDLTLKLKAGIPNLWLTIVAHDISSEVDEKQVQCTLSQAGANCDILINSKMARLLLPGLWRSSHCGLIMDWQRSAPYAILEPLASGVPIIAEPNNADNGFLKDAHILVKPGDFTPQAVAEQLSTWLTDASQREKLAAAARKYVLAHHDSKSLTEETINLYRAITEDFAQSNNQKRIAKFEMLLVALGSLSESFDKMLYDLFYLHSWKFRFNHWLKKLKGNHTANGSSRVSDLNDVQMSIND